MAGLVSELASKAHAQQWEDLLEWDGETGNLARESIAMTSKAHVPQAVSYTHLTLPTKA